MMARILPSYFDAKATIDAATRHNQRVSEYLENLCGFPGLGARVIENFRQHGALNQGTARICEIGTGAGLYAEPILAYRRGVHYESYELDPAWARWLSATFEIISHPTSGDRLSGTEPESVDLVHANGVFVYTPFFVTIKYFLEMFRVTRNLGYAVFDCYSERCFSGDAMRAWLSSGYDYPCILPEGYVKRLFEANGFGLVGEFLSNVPNDNPHPDGWANTRTHYLVFQKRSPATKQSDNK
jgi:hypothetical protein